MINNDLVERLKKFDFPILSLDDVDNLVKKLGIHFSKEFFALANIADFEYFNRFQINNLNLETDCSVIGDTLRLRNSFNLPQDTMFLYEDDASVLLMRCLGDREEIYWIAVEDFENFCEGSPLLYNPTIFPTFTDFFEYLVTEEEKRQLSNF